jgi:hypothetical protein
VRQERWETGLWGIKKTAEAGGKLTCSDLLEGAFGVTCEVSHEMHFGERLRPRATGVLQRTGGFGMPYSWYRARWYSCLSSPLPINSWRLCTSLLDTGSAGWAKHCEDAACAPALPLPRPEQAIRCRPPPLLGTADCPSHVATLQAGKQAPAQPSSYRAA